MATLVAIGYPDETTAAAAAEEAERLARDLIIQPDAIAVVRRDASGKFHTTTSHHPVRGGTSWGMFWGFLFGLLFFVPFLGMAVGAGLGALMGKWRRRGSTVSSRSRYGRCCSRELRLFLIVEKVTPDKAVAALSGSRNRAQVVAVRETRPSCRRRSRHRYVRTPSPAASRAGRRRVRMTVRGGRGRATPRPRPPAFMDRAGARRSEPPRGSPARTGRHR